MESDPLVSVQYSYTRACVNRSARVLTSCPCSVPHSDGDAAETPGVRQLHWIAGTGPFRQPHILGWAKRLESSLMASAVSTLFCTADLHLLFPSKGLRESGRGTLKNIQVKADKNSQPESNRSCQIWARIFFCTVVLTGPSFAYLTCKLHGNTCNWGLWRLDDCEDETFLSTVLGTKMCFIFGWFCFCFGLYLSIWTKNLFILICKRRSILKIKSPEPCTQRCGYIQTNSHGCKI